jgi:hypothetical protein
VGISAFGWVTGQIALGDWSLRVEKDWILLVCSYLIFPVCTIATPLIAFYALRPKIDLIVDSEGIEDKMSMYPKILWSDINGVTMTPAPRAFTSGMLLLAPKDGDAFEKYIPFWVKHLPFYKERNNARLILNLAGLRDDPSVILEAIQQARFHLEQQTDLAAARMSTR